MTKDEKEMFALEFLKTYLAGGIGSLPKREIDLTVFHLLGQTRDYRAKTNYELSTLLKVPETRIKSLRLASALKFGAINSKLILGQIVHRIADDLQYLTIENGKIGISLEDPVEKRELENFLKGKGHFAEYTLNSEVLKIAPARLVQLLFDNMENADREFDRIVREHIDDSTKSEQILAGAPLLKQKLTRLRDAALKPEILVSIASAAASAFVV